MAETDVGISYKRAREVLGVSVLADQDAIRAAYHAAAKRSHPDRPGGDADAFREVVDAYARLRDRNFAGRISLPPAPARNSPRAPADVIEITPLFAAQGGEVEH